MQARRAVIGEHDRLRLAAALQTVTELSTLVVDDVAVLATRVDELERDLAALRAAGASGAPAGPVRDAGELHPERAPSGRTVTKLATRQRLNTAERLLREHGPLSISDLALRLPLPDGTRTGFANAIRRDRRFRATGKHIQSKAGGRPSPVFALADDPRDVPRGVDDELVKAEASPRSAESGSGSPVSDEPPKSEHDTADEAASVNAGQSADAVPARRAGTGASEKPGFVSGPPPDPARVAARRARQDRADPLAGRTKRVGAGKDEVTLAGRVYHHLRGSRRTAGQLAVDLGLDNGRRAELVQVIRDGLAEGSLIVVERGPPPVLTAVP